MSTDLRIDKQQIKIPGKCTSVVYGSTSLGFIFLANLPACFALPLFAPLEGARCSLDSVLTPPQQWLLLVGHEQVSDQESMTIGLIIS